MVIRTLVWRGQQLGRDESGQAMVESAIVMPLMVFIILGTIQLAMVQHARIMTEYAAFNAARSGIVWNADRFMMENAAIISLMPTNESLLKGSDAGNPMQMLKRILQRALLYQLNRRLSQAVGVIRGQADRMIDGLMSKLPNNGIGKAVGKNAGKFLKDRAKALTGAARQAAETLATSALGNALGAGNDRMVRVDIINPNTGIGSNLGQGAGNALGSAILGGGGVGGHFGNAANEIEFDEPGSRAGGRLTIRLRYMYMMRVPFANWIIHGAWLAGKSGQRLYGAVWNPQTVGGETGFRSVASYTPAEVSAGMLGSLDARDVSVASKASASGVYLLPLSASYTMRMQSNPYRSSVQQ